MTITDDTPNPQAVRTDEDLHARLYARYRETIAESRRLDGLPFGSVPQEEADAAHAAYWQAFKTLVETPPETPAGLLIVATVLAEDIVPEAAAWKDNLNVTAARTVRDGIARLAAPDPDDVLVATWAEWRKGWLVYKEGDDIVAEGNRLGALERIIVNTPAHGLRGVAVKAGQAIWYAFTKQDMEARGGFLSPPEDMDWDIQCSASFALDLERLTGIPVHPRWDIGGQP